jgi:hypothetical protein
MIVGSITAVLHYFLYNITPVVIILTFLSAGAAWFVYDSIRNYSWQKVISKYQD